MKDHVKNENVVIINKSKQINCIGNNDTSTVTGVTIAVGRINTNVQKNNTPHNVKSKHSSSLVNHNNPVSNFRNMNNSFGNVGRFKEHSTKRYPSDVESRLKNSTCLDHQEINNHSDYKGKSIYKINHSCSNQIFYRDNYNSSRPGSRNDNTAFAVARKVLEQQQNSLAKVTPVNFPPLRAPQSIVNVHHPFLTEARTKHNDNSNMQKSKSNSIINSLQSGNKDFDRGRQNFHTYGTISNVQTTNLSPYQRPPDSYPQATVTSVLYSDTAQFSQSPSFGTSQIGQLSQYQTYDPNSYTTSVNPVISQYSTDNSIAYQQYENPQFVQTNHYPTADLTNNQFQYQAASVSQIQDSPLFIQSLQSPIAVTDQYATPNYAVRTEMIPQLRRPSRFNN